MTKRSTSRTALAASAIVLLAACGAAGESGGGATDGAPPTAVADGALRSPTPIEVVRGGSPGADTGTAAESAPAVGGGEIYTSDLAIAPWNVEYVVADSLPALPTDDTGYFYTDGSAVTAEQAAQLAAAFGIEGEPVSFDDGFGVNWRVGPDDGSDPVIWVASDGPQSWIYQAPWTDDFGSCAVSVDADGNESSDCPEVQPPAGVPTAVEAEARAEELLTTLGIDTSTVSFESVRDDWFTGVEAADDRDPRAPVRSWSFGFGAEGVLQYASGALATPAPVGPYPLVDLDTAVSRLSDGFLGGLGAGGGIAIAEPALPTVGVTESTTVEGDSVAGDPGEPPSVGAETGAPVEPAGPVDSMPIDVEPAPEPVDPEPIPESLPVEPEAMPVEPVPVEPIPDGEPVVISLVDVQADLWWAWDVDGVVWLLPAYRFLDVDGGWHVVPAVTDEFLIEVEPPAIDTPLPEPAPEPLPAPPPDAPEVIEPDVDPDAAVELLEEFVGLSIEEFTAEAAALGYGTRVVVQDGEPLAVTADYSETRVNVAVEGPRVVAVEGIG